MDVCGGADGSVCVTASEEGVCVCVACVAERSGNGVSECVVCVPVTGEGVCVCIVAYDVACVTEIAGVEGESRSGRPAMVINPATAAASESELTGTCSLRPVLAWGATVAPLARSTPPSLRLPTQLARPNSAAMWEEAIKLAG